MKRGRILFLRGLTGEATHVVVEGFLLPLRPPYEGKRAREVKEETLVRVLRERTPLQDLPPKTLLALLRGEEGAAVEEVRRFLTLHELGG